MFGCKTRYPHRGLFRNGDGRHRKNSTPATFFNFTHKDTRHSMAQCTAGEFLDAVRRGEDISHLNVARHINTARSLEGRLAIHEAVLRGVVDRVRDLVEMGADVNAVSHSGRTAVQMAVESNSELMTTYMVSLAQADFARAEPGTTPAVLTVLFRHNSQTVLATLARQTYADPCGRLLRHVVLRNSPRMLDAAVAHLVPCDFNIVVERTQSLLYYAAVKECWSAVEHLVMRTDADVCFVHAATQHGPLTGLLCGSDMMGSAMTPTLTSVLDLCALSVNSACVRNMVQRGARILTGFDAITNLIKCHDPTDILLVLLRTITPTVAASSKIVRGARCAIYGRTINADSSLASMLLLNVASLYVSPLRWIEWDHRTTSCRGDEAIHDQLLRGKSFEEHPSLMWDGSPVPGARELSPLVRAGLRPWSPSLHAFVFSFHFRATVAHVYLAWSLAPIQMPAELWLLVIGMISRAWFPLEAPPFTRPHRSSAHPGMGAWRTAICRGYHVNVL